MERRSTQSHYFFLSVFLFFFFFPDPAPFWRPLPLFKSGVFITDIPGYLVLIDEIDHTTSRVEKVRITETKNGLKPKLILAEYGYMTITDNKRNMQFDLYNGEIHSFNLKGGKP